MHGDFERIKNIQGKLIINNQKEYKINVWNEVFNANEYGRTSDFKHYFESPDLKKMNINPREIDILKIQISFIGIEDGKKTPYTLEASYIHKVKHNFTNIFIDILMSV